MKNIHVAGVRHEFSTLDHFIVSKEELENGQQWLDLYYDHWERIPREKWYQATWDLITTLRGTPYSGTPVGFELQHHVKNINTSVMEELLF